MFTVDGIQWPYPCDIERVVEVKPSEISGMLLDKSYFNDVIGTYLQMTIRIAVPLNYTDEYNEIHDILTNPVDGHSFVLPYGAGSLTVTARVDSVKDTYVRLPNGARYWKGIQFTITSNAPIKQMSLSQILARGRSPLPELSEVQTGDVYTYTSSGWVKTVYTNADDVYY